jgi:hypothetical protein
MKYSLLRSLTLTAALGACSVGLGVVPAMAVTAVAEGPLYVGELTMPPSASASLVKNAITTALTKRGWTVKLADDATVVGYLRHRGIDSTLTFHYDAQHIDILSDSYKVESGGALGERANPHGWIDNLKHDIPRYLAAAMASPK